MFTSSADSGADRGWRCQMYPDRVTLGYLHFNQNCQLVSGSFQDYRYLCSTSRDSNLMSLGCGLGGGIVKGLR